MWSAWRCWRNNFLTCGGAIRDEVVDLRRLVFGAIWARFVISRDADGNDIRGDWTTQWAVGKAPI